MKVKTSSGFECELNESIAQDWRFVKAVAMADSDDESDKLRGYTKIIELLLGKSGEQKLMEHVKTADGIVPIADINKETIELIQAMKQNQTVKN